MDQARQSCSATITRTSGCGEGEAGQGPGVLGPLPALGGEPVRAAREEGGVASVGEPRLQSLGEVRGGPGSAPLVERDDARPVQAPPRGGLRPPAGWTRRGPRRLRAAASAAVGGRDLVEGEPTGGGQALRVVRERRRPPIPASGSRPPPARSSLLSPALPFRRTQLTPRRSSRPIRSDAERLGASGSVPPGRASAAFRRARAPRTRRAASRRLRTVP